MCIWRSVFHWHRSSLAAAMAWLQSPQSLQTRQRTRQSIEETCEGERETRRQPARDANHHSEKHHRVSHGNIVFTCWNRFSKTYPWTRWPVSLHSDLSPAKAAKAHRRSRWRPHPSIDQSHCLCAPAQACHVSVRRRVYEKCSYALSSPLAHVLLTSKWDFSLKQFTWQLASDLLACDAANSDVLESSSFCQRRLGCEIEYLVNSTCEWRSLLGHTRLCPPARPCFPQPSTASAK